MDNELAAVQAEISHHHYRATLALAGVKRSRLPKALDIPRPKPWEPESEETAVPTRQARADGRRQATTVAEVVSVLSRAFGPSRG